MILFFFICACVCSVRVFVYAFMCVRRACARLAVLTVAARLLR